MLERLLGRHICTETMLYLKVPAERREFTLHTSISPQASEGLLNPKQPERDFVGIPQDCFQAQLPVYGT